MTVENWPDRGFYRGNKQKMVEDAMRFGGTIVINPLSTTTPIPAIEPEPPQPHIAATEPGDPKSMGYTGNSCQNPDCGSLRMVVSGHCEVCLDCGSSSGCS